MEQVFKVLFGVLTMILVVCGGFGFLLLGTAITAPSSPRCRSMQSEAKTNLSGIFTAQKAFFGEYNTYSTDLLAVNWAPDGTPLYVYGFRTPGGPERIEGVADLDPTRSHTADPRLVSAADGTERYRTAKMRDLDGRQLGPEDLVPGSTATATTFTASAAGDIDSDSGEVRLDVWTIDERKQLTAVSNDCLD